MPNLQVPMSEKEHREFKKYAQRREQTMAEIARAAIAALMGSPNLAVVTPKQKTNRAED